MKNKNIIPAVERALAVMEYISDAGRPVSQAEICRVVGVSATSCYRILNSLMMRYWVRRSESGQYTVAAGLLSVMLQMERSGFLFDSAQSVLDEIARETQLTCKLSVRVREDQVSLLRGESPAAFSVTMHRGAHFPLIEGSVGAVLLSRESEETVRALVEKTEELIPEKLHPDDVFARIREVRKNGWTLNRLAARGSAVAVSVPVYDSRGRTAAALTLLGLESDFDAASLKKLLPRLKQAADKISKDHFLQLQ